jgi:hypothetical protein
MDISNKDSTNDSQLGSITRRDFFKVIAAGGVAVAGGLTLHNYLFKEPHTETFIGSIKGYRADIRGSILGGLKELGVTSFEIKGKRVLLKPNLVEPHSELSHTNTHPLLNSGGESRLCAGSL